MCTCSVLPSAAPSAPLAPLPHINNLEKILKSHVSAKFAMYNVYKADFEKFSR